ncbi:MAG: CDP-alcohol phosphatidyltransferase family protein [Bacteroidia bacterium]
MKKHIPNIITLGNLACGCVGLAFAHVGNIWGAALMVILAAVFDFFDGFAARLLHVKSEIGAQLDSLSDLVSFGVLPAFIAHELFVLGSMHQEWSRLYFLNGANSWSLLVFVFALAGAYRLARFNVTQSDSDEFRGLPIPAAGLYLSSFALIYRFGLHSTPFSPELIETYATSNIGLLVTAAALGLLMVSKVKLLTLKVSSFGLKGNEFRIVLILGSILLLIFFGVLAIQLIVLLYLLLSLIQNATVK